MTETTKISLIGTGNVGSHLARELNNNGIRISHLYSPQKTHAKELANQVDAIVVDSIIDLPNNQLVLVCVPDDQIKNVLDKIDTSNPVAYTSGSVEINSLPHRLNLGVFYPLQTFTKGHKLNIFEVPFLIEANTSEFAQELFNLAWRLSRKVEFADSEKRKDLHLAAVWVNNFTNHMVYVAEQYLKDKKLDIELLKPLLAETMQKLASQSPFEAQTGPARRGDLKTIERHVEKLDGRTKEIYRLISQNILQTYSHNDQL